VHQLARIHVGGDTPAHVGLECTKPFAAAVDDGEIAYPTAAALFAPNAFSTFPAEVYWAPMLGLTLPKIEMRS
jgi:hypothetical protein